MKTTYEELWRRAQKHLEDDKTDLYVLEEKGEEEEATACSLDGMVNAYHSLKYLLMAMLYEKGESFDESMELHYFLDMLLITDAYPIRKDNLLWAYEMENWDCAYVLQNGASPYVKPLTHAEMVKMSSRIYKLKDIFDEKEVLEDW